VSRAEAWRIRRARAGDEPTVSALLDDAEALHARLQPRLFRGPAGPARRLGFDRADERWLIAEDARGVAAGVLRMRLYDTPPQAWMAPGRRAHLEDLAVQASRRRAGCARALLDAATTWARREGATQLLLTVWEGNAAAERLYASLGYRRLGQVLGTDL
jgi:ribosomal protein S18 acetylase RimI-like enzyme